MIRKILKLQNIGLLQDSTQNGAVDLAQVTMIYADNGRGKSTLASVLRACQLGDAGRLNARKTIDATNGPEIKFLLPTGTHVDFTANAWTAAMPDISVFDSEFVEQNVYSGFEVRADQRQSLLEFALGDQTVQLKQQIDRLTQEIDLQTRKRTQAEKTLTGFASPYSVVQFVALQPIPDAQQQIDVLNKRIEAANNAVQLIARKDPVELPLFNFDVVAVFEVLKKQIEDVEKSAEAIVKKHLARYDSDDFEDWISRGQNYVDQEDCAFCGQNVTGLELIAAYRSHFNKAYAELKRDVVKLEELINAELADTKIDAAVSAAATNTARIDAWRDHRYYVSVELDEAVLRCGIKQLREHLGSLVAQKQKSPLELIGSPTECATASATLASINAVIVTYNSAVLSISKMIGDFKTRLATENTAVLKTEVKKLEAAQKRELIDVKIVVENYQNAEVDRKRLDGEKIQARQQIDALMQTTLTQYQQHINDLLGVFGAEFTIEQLKPTYVGGGEPRSDYGISLRNKSVKLGNRTDPATGQSFATTLSEADKRTLAVSFFIARLKADPKLSDKLVVLDDPISSLDRNRRHQSIRLIANLANHCRQLIILSHDAYFVRELRERLAEKKPTAITPSIISLKRAQHGYSVFSPCDIDDVCSSDYYRHHRLVSDYVDGKSTANNRDVAKAIRPLLEGYYHRRFPGKIPRKLMFGQIIALASQAQPGDPLAYLQQILKELGEVNDYAGQFHHDTNAGYETVSVVDGELLNFAKRALKLIYQNG